MAISTTSASTDPRHYIWWFPGSPVRVHVDLRVIEGLQERLRDTGRGVPDQGLLFGRILEGATEILEFQPAFNGSAPEMIAELSAERGKRLLVGYYRTEHGEALRLNENDLLLFKTFFGKPYHVFLLMQVNGFAAPNATFFFSQGDRKISEFPFLEFPLDASLLATEERDRISRCRQATGQPVALAVQQSLPPESGRPRKRGRTLPRIAGVFVIAVLLLAVLWIAYQPFRERPSRVWNGGWSAAGKPQPALSSPSSPHPRIGLQARRQDRDLELTWDRESPWVAAATSGFISIQDGSVKRQIPLDAQQLHGEVILYSPTSDQVLIQLTITGPTGVMTESVRVIRAGAIPTYKTVVSTPSDDPGKPRESPSEPIQVAQASKPFTAPPLTKPAPSPIPLNAPPVLSSNPDHSASPVVSFGGPQTLAPPQQPVPPQTPTPAAYDPPVPLTKVGPTYPAQFKLLALKPTVVAIRVTIDKTGKVLKAEPLPQESAHKLFIMEAVHAAALWKFQPARRGDEPVASESILHFTFSQ